MAFRTSRRPSSISLNKTNGVKVHAGNGVDIRYLVLNVKRAPTNNLGGAQGDRLPDAAADHREARLPRPRQAAVLDGAGGTARARRRVQDGLRRPPNVAKAKAELKAADVTKPVPITSGTRRRTTATRRRTSSPRSSARSSAAACSR